jgi:hypothetical protein
VFTRSTAACCCCIYLAEVDAVYWNPTLPQSSKVGAGIVIIQIYYVCLQPRKHQMLITVNDTRHIR